jgi:hypothetical protein
MEDIKEGDKLGGEGGRGLSILAGKLLKKNLQVSVKT